MAMRMVFDKLEEVPTGCREKARAHDDGRYSVDPRDLTSVDLTDVFMGDAHLRTLTKSPRSQDRFSISRKQAKDHALYQAVSRAAALHGAEITITDEDADVELVKPAFRITEKEVREDFQKYLRLSEKAAEVGECVEIVKE